MENESIFKKIRANFEFYSKVEKKIAQYILEDPQKFIGNSMDSLATKLGISQGSINNFAKKTVNGGFALLKLQIAQQLSLFASSTNSFESVKDGENAKDALRRTVSQANCAFENTFSLNSQQTLDCAVSAILNAKRIQIYGVYASSVVARNLYLQLSSLGFCVNFVDDILLCQVSASMLGKDDLVIAVSTSGKTKDIIDAVNIAQKNGVHVISLTSNANSPLAKISEITLIAASSGANINNSMYETQLSQLILADMLYTYIMHLIDKDGKSSYYKTAELLSSHNMEG